MTTQVLQVRRATIEDLPQLVELWKAEQLPVQHLEKHFNEFQVVAEEGKLVGALAMQVIGKDGRIHSEVFKQAQQADALREKLWERARMIANNHGLFRVWSQLEAPYWKATLGEAAETQRAKLPAAFANDSQNWRILQLKDEEALNVSLDKEFALFREAEKEETAKLFRQARVLKVAAALIGVGVFALVVIWAILFFQAQQRVKAGGGLPIVEAGP